MSPHRIQMGPEDHVDGPREAPIILVEYGDYQCPYCAKAYVSVKHVKEVLGERLCFVFRNFPLTHLHPDAMPAAEAAEAAGAQGRFWDMYGVLYENQRELEVPALVGYAEELGLDVERFERDLEEHRFLERIRREVREGERIGAKGTPSFFLDGQRYEGDYSPDGLLAAVEGGPAAYGG
ncbi:MAG TPA: thioredoxin domain-containing protein [Archangium sp.]|nr:thioredoxin domain-containing protein [Archangium sp.]